MRRITINEYRIDLNKVKSYVPSETRQIVFNPDMSNTEEWAITFGSKLDRDQALAELDNLFFAEKAPPVKPKKKVKKDTELGEVVDVVNKLSTLLKEIDKL